MKNAKRENFRIGDFLVNQGRPINKIFFIVRGIVEVVLHYDKKEKSEFTSNYIYSLNLDFCERVTRETMKDFRSHIRTDIKQKVKI